MKFFAVFETIFSLALKLFEFLRAKIYACGAKIRKKLFRKFSLKTVKVFAILFPETKTRGYASAISGRSRLKKMREYLTNLFFGKGLN